MCVKNTLLCDAPSSPSLLPALRQQSQENSLGCNLNLNMQRAHCLSAGGCRRGGKAPRTAHSSGGAHSRRLSKVLQTL